MEHFEYFWQHNFSENKTPKLLIDFDTFLFRFCEEIYQTTGIVLTDIQKQYVKCLIDPSNQNQVYKSGFLLFIRDFWSIPSNRTKIFNMKLNLTKIQFVQVLPMAGSIKITLRYPIQTESSSHSQKILEEYLIQQDQVSLISSNRQTSNLKISKPLKNIGFITVGSSTDQGDISIDNPFINGQHIKLIYMTHLVQLRQSTPSFPIPPTPKNIVYIRDISRSNRIRQVLDNENQMIALKKDMVIGNIGYMENIYEIMIDSLAESAQDQLTVIQNEMNTDRKSYIEGEPDKPIKKIINYDFTEVTEPIIADLYDRNLYYPEPNKKSKSNTKEKSDSIPLKFTLINKKTLEKVAFSSKNKKRLVVGRSENCDVIINDISIRPNEFIFENINESWFIKHVEKAQVFIARNGSESCYNSNRQKLIEQYPNRFSIRRNILMDVEVVGTDVQQQQF